MYTMFNREPIQFNSRCLRFQGQGLFLVVWVHGFVFAEHSLLVSLASVLVQLYNTYV